LALFSNADGENTVDLKIVYKIKYSMPSTTDQAPGRWTEYYGDNEEKIDELRELNEMPPKNFETISDNLIWQPGELALQVATNPYNFILLSGTPASKKVHMIHHCFTTRENDRSILITGVAGDMKTAPLKSFHPREATSSLVKPRTSGRSTISRTNIPSIKQFITCNSADDFAQLNGDNRDQNKIENISAKPGMFWTHPSIFYILNGSRELLATDAGMRIIRSLQKNCRDANNDNNSENEEEKSPSPKTDETLTVTDTARGYHGLVVFLWALANGMGTNVGLFDPPLQPKWIPKANKLFLNSSKEENKNQEPLTQMSTQMQGPKREIQTDSRMRS
jgi:hypothetical protein